MRTWIFTSALALTALGGLAFWGNEAAGPEVAEPVLVVVQIAAIPLDEQMSDACVWSPEAAAAGAVDQCRDPEIVVGVFESAGEQDRALIWPNDFIAMTVDAADAAWDATVTFLTDIYKYAFEAEEPPKKAGS